VESRAIERGEPSTHPARARPARGIGLPRDAWSRLGLSLCLALGVVAYHPLLWLRPERSLPEEIEQWLFVPSDTTAPVVIALSLWLLYRRRVRLRDLPSRPGSPVAAGALLAAGLACHAWATYTRATDLLVPSLMLGALGLGVLWKGAAAARALSLPVAFLAFAMPLPPPLLNELLFSLQLWTTELAGALLSALGIPHHVAGEQIVRSRATFSVIEACSGLRSVQTLTMVSILMVDLFRRRGWHAALVVLAAPPFAFALNGLRALLLILNSRSDVVSVHTLQGIAILLAGLVLLFLWDGLLERALRSHGARPPARAVAARSGGGPGPRARAAAAVVLGLAAAASLWLPRWPGGGPQRGSVKPALRAALGMPAEELPIDRVFLGSAWFLETVHERYGGPGAPVELFVGVGSRSQRGHSPLSPKTGVPGTGWIDEGVTRSVEVEPGRPRVSARVLRSGADRLLVASWYLGAGPWWSELARWVLALDQSPWYAPDPIFAVRVGVPILAAAPPGIENARERLEGFALELRPALGPFAGQRKESS
jgi:exosortase